MARNSSSPINRDGNDIADSTIMCVAEDPYFEHRFHEMVEPLRNKPHREELGRHSFHCLPLVVGNQYGFVLKSMVTWRAVWNGGPNPQDTTITIDEGKSETAMQIVSSHFGAGIITVQNRFSFRTPPGVNLMVLDPPNYFNYNIANLFGVIETDNLRRDFTFNLKIVKPGIEVQINKGDIISGVIPIPRYFVDDFELALASNHFSEETLDQEKQQFRKFAEHREQVDVHKPHQVGKLYWRGVDADNTPFDDHQKKLRPTGWTLNIGDDKK
jgi:Family of unknown function (DUF6065)